MSTNENEIDGALDDDGEFDTYSKVPPADTQRQFSDEDDPHQNNGTLAARVFSPANLGLLNLFRTTPNSAAARATTHPELVATMRLNMINTYLKFIIQAILYLAAALLLGMMVSFALQYSIKILVPVVLLIVLQMAARNIHQSDNQFHAPDAHRNLSLGDNVAWMIEKKNTTINNVANYAVGLFQPLARKLAQSNVLDRQLAHIPDNRERSFGI